ncbi:MAG: nucleoside kinase [Bacteroidales bacterium]|nr:nucleoside kinase [Bacteroidales bacterium]
MTKLEQAIQNYASLNADLGLRDVTDLNLAITSGRTQKVIDDAERQQEADLHRIAGVIASRPEIKMILLSGPSSSGKTSTANRLALHLTDYGKKPLILSMDNWFVNREDSPLDENGEKDYESIYALDIKTFQRDLRDLIDGVRIAMPTYNFSRGEREFRGETLQLHSGNLLIIEGIHALNPMLTETIADRNKFLLYASALTSLRIDDETRISTSENRLIRRMCRDYTTRGVSAEDTLHRWQSVRRGEEKWIFPYQENADVMFNTAMIYELSALQPKALFILRQVPISSPMRAEAERLIHFLSFFTPISDIGIPSHSIIREFIGGSAFDVA